MRGVALRQDGPSLRQTQGQALGSGRTERREDPTPDCHAPMESGLAMTGQRGQS